LILFANHVVLRARMKDEEAEASCNIRAKMVEMLPDSYKECLFDYDQLGADASPDLATGKAEFNGLWFFGAKDNSVNCGLECSGIANLRLCVC
jgi:hypothetical protein